MADKQQILKQITEEQINFIALWFTDITGIVKSILIPASQFEQVIEFGKSFDGSSIEGFARVAESDMMLVPDLETLIILPWNSPDEKTAAVICSVYTYGGDPFIGDPRSALIRNLREAEDMGYRYHTGLELEFFLFPLDDKQRPILKSQQDIASYFDIPDVPIRSLRRDMLSTLQFMGIEVNAMHSEIGSGQHEINIQYSDALTSADNLIKTRIALKTVAKRHNLHCTFMPRPKTSQPGSGMHTHQSLHDINTGENIFADEESAYNLSPIARHFLAGQLSHAKAMCAVLAPLVNSYKRLGTSLEAPSKITWARLNRSALIRVPHIVGGDISHTRLEIRCPDPSVNPYLAKAVMLRAGLDGIRQQMNLEEPLDEILLSNQHSGRREQMIQHLPKSLDEALDIFERDEVVQDALGQFISERFISAKREEYEAYHKQVTAWETERYLTRY